MGAVAHIGGAGEADTAAAATKPAVFASRTVRIKTVNERGFNILRDKIIYNL